MKSDVPPQRPAARSHSQFDLLRQRRFAPFFWTQFLGAGNDNLFKFAFTVLVTYQLQVSWLPASVAGLVIGALFITPFLLFSATAGQWADKHDKARLMRLIKVLEVAIMAVAAWGFVAQWVPLLLLCVFLMGLHSTFFGPVKYAYLPQHLGDHELTGGNGMVEMGTFVAILLGTLLGGVVMGLGEHSARWAALACVLLALAGWGASLGIPASPSADPRLRINRNPFTETFRNLQLAWRHPGVFRALLGISWMWFFGSLFLSQFPVFARDVVGGSEQVATLLLMVFSVGIAAGSLLCEVLSQRRVEVGLVPLGAIGMSVFAWDLFATTQGLSRDGTQPLRTVADFLAWSPGWRIMADLGLLSLSAGLYSVPMYALIQLRSAPTHRARIIAANNVLNALFMIASALLAGALLGAGLSVPQVFGAVAVLNALVVAYLFWLVPEYVVRLVMWGVARGVYRLRVRGDHHLPTEGAAIVVCNHVSFADPVILGVLSPRPMVFLMDHRIFASPWLGWFFRLVHAIPIAPQADHPEVYAAALERARDVLRQGGLVGLFPEGAITRDGLLSPFKGGIMKLLETDPVPVIPAALHNLWGSYFSRVDGEAMSRPFRRGVFNPVGLVVGEPLAPAEVTPERLQARVQALLGESMP